MIPEATLCPIGIRESILAYIHEGRQTGSFLQAVMENDLREAVACADSINVWLIPHIVAYLVNCAPANVWGSPEAVARHLKAKRNELRAQQVRDARTPLLNDENDGGA